MGEMLIRAGGFQDSRRRRASTSRGVCHVVRTHCPVAISLTTFSCRVSCLNPAGCNRPTNGACVFRGAPRAGGRPAWNSAWEAREAGRKAVTRRCDSQSLVLPLPQSPPSSLNAHENHHGRQGQACERAFFHWQMGAGARKEHKQAKDSS